MRRTPLFNRAFAALSVFVACAAVACGGGGRTSSSDAHLIVAYPAGLTDVGLDGAARGVIAKTTKVGAPTSPAVSPNGRSIAYIVAPPASATDNGADLWVADRDGSHARLMMRHPQPNHSVRVPRWLDNGELLVVIDRAGSCDGCNPATTSQQELDRIDVRTGEATPLRRDVTAFDVSGDRSSLVFPDTSSEQAASLAVAAFPDGATRAVVPLARSFAEITSPRFSPDGSRIAFAAADGRSTRGDERFVSREPGAANAPDLDGLPENVWVVDASGQNLRLVASLREDQPAIAWSPDGAALLVVGASALYRIDVATGALARIGAGAVHGQLAYVPALP